MPDIDIDFCYEKKARGNRLCSAKYGADRVAQIVLLVPWQLGR